MFTCLWFGVANGKSKEQVDSLVTELEQGGERLLRGAIEFQQRNRYPPHPAILLKFLQQQGA